MRRLRDRSRTGVRRGRPRGLTPPRWPAIAAAVLAGGRSRRMGRDKGSIPWGPTTLLGNAVAFLRPRFGEVLVCVRREGGARAVAGPRRVRTVRDRPGTEGPLAGIAAALAATRRRWIFVTACDMPFPSERLVAALVAARRGVDAVLPRGPGGVEPLYALYARGCLGPARALLAQGVNSPRALARRVRIRILPRARVRAADPDGEALRGANTPAALRAARAHRTTVDARHPRRYPRRTSPA